MEISPTFSTDVRELYDLCGVRLGLDRREICGGAFGVDYYVNAWDCREVFC